MEVIFGLYLDGRRGWTQKNAFDRLVLGPSGLLSQLELYLGLSGKRQSRLQRTLLFRKVLENLDDGNRFYSRSIRVDDIGVARRLLEWRDDLYLHGWNGSFGRTAHSKRLHDLADIEMELKNEGLSPGNGERLLMVAAALRELRTPITSLELLEPLERHPLRWQEVIRLLSFSFKSRFGKPLAQPGTLLHGLQRYLLQKDVPALSKASADDGSVTVLTADTPLAAAYRASRELQDAQGRTLLVHPDEPFLLEDVLVSQGLPEQGRSARGEGRPVFQLLPLAIRLLQKPLDVEALFSFLALPEEICPLDPGLSQHLAGVVSRYPGIGSREWNEVIERFKKIDAGKGAGGVEELKRWLGLSHPAGSPMPLEKLLHCTERVSAFLESKKDASADRDGSPAVLSAGFDQASAFHDALSMLIAQGVRHAGSYQIEQLLVMAGSGSVRCREREAGSVPGTSHPGAVCEPFSHVLWWWAAEPHKEQNPPWTAGERSFLEGEGVKFPSQETSLAWQAEDWRRPVLAATGKVTLILPPETEDRHPLWLELSRYVSAIGVLQVERIISGSNGPAVSLPVLDLPRRKAFWNLPESIILGDHHFSPTSLETFIAAPSCWFLDHVARIRQPQSSDINDGTRLYGLLAHRIVQELVALLQDNGSGAVDIDAWFDEAFLRLVRHEGALLLQPGRGADLETLRLTARRAVYGLLPVLMERGAQRMDSETELQGNVAGSVMNGRADLFLVDRDGKPSVIDMKWGSTEERRKSLKEGTHLQLLAYAAMAARQDRDWPALAWYIIRKSRLIADRKGFSAEAEVVVPGKGESSEALWHRVLDSFLWRKALMEKGILPIAGVEVDDDEAVAPPEGVIGFRTGDDLYNPYRFLEGWEAHR